jgi:hypothetical protein
MQISPRLPVFPKERRTTTKIPMLPRKRRLLPRNLPKKQKPRHPTTKMGRRNQRRLLQKPRLLPKSRKL